MLYVFIEQYGGYGLKKRTTKLLASARGARFGERARRANSLLKVLFGTTARLEGRLHDNMRATELAG